MIEDDVHGIQILMVQAMTLQQLGGKVALQRSKAQTVMAISFQQEPDGAIAKTAHAIVKDYWTLLRLSGVRRTKMAFTNTPASTKPIYSPRME